jgi:hypothetical protein
LAFPAAGFSGSPLNKANAIIAPKRYIQYFWKNVFSGTTAALGLPV